MKRIITILLLVLSTQLIFAQKKEQKAVRETFKNYKSAILNDRGEEAANQVDSRTVAYYSKILNLVLNADSSEISESGILDKVCVLTIRHKAKKSDLDGLDGRSLLVYAIKEGMVGKNSVANIEVNEVEIDGTFAKGQLESNGQKAPFYFHFYKEEGSWKLDITSIFEIGANAFNQMIAQSGEAENDFIFTILTNLTGKKPDSSIWTPFNRN